MIYLLFIFYATRVTLGLKAVASIFSRAAGLSVPIHPEPHKHSSFIAGAAAIWRDFVPLRLPALICLDSPWPESGAYGDGVARKNSLVPWILDVNS